MSIALLPAVAPPPAFARVDGDRHLLALWLDGRPPSTVAAYGREAARLLAWCDRAGCELRGLTLDRLQAFVLELPAGAPGRRRSIAAVKSLIGFGHRIGYLPWDVAAPVRKPPAPDRLSARILSRAQVLDLVRGATGALERAVLVTLYLAGLRVAELAGLRWGDLTERSDLGAGWSQATVTGKGGRTRTVALPPRVAVLWGLLAPDGPDPSSWIIQPAASRQAVVRGLQRTVSRAGRRIGVRGLSPHWLRHAWASHGIDAGVEWSVIQAQGGWADARTMGRYLHARPRRSVGAALDWEEDPDGSIPTPPHEP